MREVGNDAAAILKAKLKRLEDVHGEPTRVRLHRAISWLARAQVETKDPDAHFVFLWVAFNAAYASEMGVGESERNRLQRFIDLLVSLDVDGRLYALAFDQFSGAIRSMIDNRFVFEPFWRALREHDSSNRWEEQFTSSKRLALQALMEKKTGLVLSIVFDRLYVLRNQLVHGGATWNSSVNRTQVKDGASLMMQLVPIVIDLMLDHAERDFGEVLYPVV